MSKKADLLGICIEFCRTEYPDDPEFASKGARMKAAIEAAARMVLKKSEALQDCPCCGQPIGEVITSYTDSTSIHTLYKLVKYCSENNVHEFKTSDVKHLLNHTQYANMNHLDRFGGIVYRPIDPKTQKPYKSTYYGINLTRAWEFFRNERTAPVQLTTNRLTGERVASTEKYMKDFPGIGEFLDTDGIYDPEHIVPDDNAVPRQDSLPTVPQHYPNQ